MGKVQQPQRVEGCDNGLRTPSPRRGSWSAFHDLLVESKVERQPNKSPRDAADSAVVCKTASLDRTSGRARDPGCTTSDPASDLAKKAEEEGTAASSEILHTGGGQGGGSGVGDQGRGPRLPAVDMLSARARRVACKAFLFGA